MRLNTPPAYTITDTFESSTYDTPPSPLSSPLPPLSASATTSTHLVAATTATTATTATVAVVTAAAATTAASAVAAPAAAAAAVGATHPAAIINADVAREEGNSITSSRVNSNGSSEIDNDNDNDNDKDNNKTEKMTAREIINLLDIVNGSAPTLENIYICDHDCITESLNPFFIKQITPSSYKMRNKNSKKLKYSSPRHQFSISSSSSSHMKNFTFKTNNSKLYYTNYEQEKMNKRNLKNDYEKEKQSSFMKIEELKWQLSRIKNKIKNAEKHKNELKTVNNAIRVTEESPIDHFYGNYSIVDTVELSEKSKNKFDFYVVKENYKNKEIINMTNKSNNLTINTDTITDKIENEEKSYFQNFVSAQSKKEKEKYFSENEKSKNKIHIFEDFIQGNNDDIDNDDNDDDDDDDDNDDDDDKECSSSDSEEDSSLGNNHKEHSKEHSLTEIYENSDKLITAEGEKIKSESENEIVMIMECNQKNKTIKINQNKILCENSIIHHQLQNIIKKQKVEIKSMNKLLLSFRNFIGEITDKFKKEMKEIALIIPIQKNKIVQLENQCVFLEKQMFDQKKVVQEELSSACKMLLSANDLILLQKKTIESLTISISELNEKSIQYNENNNANKVVNKVVTSNNVGEEIESHIMRSMLTDKMDKNTSKTENEKGESKDGTGTGKILKQERGSSADYFRGAKRFHSMAGRGNFFVKKELNKNTNQNVCVVKE